MSRPIEAGCMAVVVNSGAGNDGKIVAVTNLIEEVADGKWWRFTPKLTSTLGRSIDFANESQLRRIDDDHELGSWDDCVFKPDSLKVKP